MSIYLKDSMVLLHSNLVATDAACCCNNCRVGATAVIALNATGSGGGCPTMNISDSLTVSLGAGGGFVPFNLSHDCLSGCSGGGNFVFGRTTYLGSMTCNNSNGAFALFIQAVGACCAAYILPCSTPNFSNCECADANGAPGTITSPGVFTFTYTGSSGGLSWTLVVTVTITFP